MNAETEIVNDVLQTFKVRCFTKNTVEEVRIINPAWECCPICKRTGEECGFIYSVVPINT